MSGTLQLTFLGVGNATAQRLGNGSAVLETDDGTPLLLLDSGHSRLLGKFGNTQLIHESASRGDALRALGLRVAWPLPTFRLGGGVRSGLRRVV